MTAPKSPKRGRVHVAGAGICGIWQALRLAQEGYEVRLSDAEAMPFKGSSSRLAGAMIAPWCEMDGAEPVIARRGPEGLRAWLAQFPGLTTARGTIVVAPARDRAELRRFAAATAGHRELSNADLKALEPSLEHFPGGLLFAEEIALEPEATMAALIDRFTAEGGELALGQALSNDAQPGPDEILIDCRGLGARADIKGLRGVRGERAVIDAPEVKIRHVVRLLHPRHPIYIVPWGGGRFMVGATVVEREDGGLPTVRGLLEILGSAYAVDPAFAEARVVDIAAGVRPAFASNVPRVFVRGRRLSVNGAYRHGFLLGPVLAEAVASYLTRGEVDRDFVEVLAN